MNSKVLQEATKINENLNVLEQSVQTMETLLRRATNATTSDEEKRVNAKMDKYIQDDNALIGGIHKQIKALERYTARNGATDPIARTQVGNLSKRFLIALKAYQQTQTRYQKSQRSKMERQYRIVNPNATEREMDKALSSNNHGPIFAQALQGARHGESLQMKQDVESRHETVVQLARSIEQLAQMFNEMQIMIEAQDGQINQVTADFNEGRENIEAATNEMTLAVTNKRKANRRCCYLTLCIILLIIVVLIVIFVTVVQPFLVTKHFL